MLWLFNSFDFMLACVALQTETVETVADMLSPSMSFLRLFYQAYFPVGLLPLAFTGKALGSFPQDFL